MLRKKRSQVSMEYMVMVGFTLLMIFPILLIYGSERQGITNQVSFSQAKQVATKIADNAETVYYLGKPSQTTIRVYIPSNIEQIDITNSEVVLYLDMGRTNPTAVIAYSNVNLTGSINALPGIHEIVLIAGDDYVNVTNA